MHGINNVGTRHVYIGCSVSEQLLCMHTNYYYGGVKEPLYILCK